MPEIEVPTLMVGIGLLIGIAFGATARWAEFCTFGAIANAYYGGDKVQLRSWFLAIAVAMVLTQAADAAGWIDLQDSIYLTPSFGWLGAIVGGLCFGFGMALVGTCGYGSLVRLGNGDLRSLVVFLVLGLTAYMTLRGLTGLFREAVIERTNLDLSAIGSQSLAAIVSQGTGLAFETARWTLVALSVAVVLWVCLSSPAFRASFKGIFSGVLMGALVFAGWIVTGVVGADDFDPAPLESLTFVAPPGEALVYLITYTGATVNFGIGTVGGVIVGAFLVARLKGEFMLESFDGNREMVRHLGGAALMGFGGVTAMGCTVGQGLTGLSTLAITAPLALGAIFIGAAAGLRYLTLGRLWPPQGDLAIR